MEDPGGADGDPPQILFTDIGFNNTGGRIDQHRERSILLQPFARQQRIGQFHDPAGNRGGDHKPV